MRAVKTHDATVLVVAEAGDDAPVREALSAVAQLSICETAAPALEALAQASVDIVLVTGALGERHVTDFIESVRREHPGTDLVAISDPEAPELGEGREGERAIDVLTRPVDPSALRRRVEQILLRRHLLEENRRLRDSLHTAEACRALAPCLEPGNVYIVALDLLLGSLSRGRGLAVFHRMAVPLRDGAAFRGFSDTECSRLRTLLIEDKPLDVAGFAELEVVERSPIHSALQELGLDAPPMLSVPIIGQHGECGVLWILEDGRGFEAEELARAGMVLGYATAALHNAERYHLAKERAFIDDVTEVYNARYLQSATENEIRRAERYGNPLSVLFLDLDRFKLVNDRYGHLVGSNTLRSLSQVLLQCVRQVDTLARYGGDEFTILLVDTAHDEALRIAERIRRTVEGHLFEAAREGSLRLTISIGVATYPDHGSARDRLLDMADKAMYRAKSMGRNRVCSAVDLED